MKFPARLLSGTGMVQLRTEAAVLASAGRFGGGFVHLGTVLIGHLLAHIVLFRISRLPKRNDCTLLGLGLRSVCATNPVR